MDKVSSLLVNTAKHLAAEMPDALTGAYNQIQS